MTQQRSTFEAMNTFSSETARRARSADGLEIAFVERGAGATAILFIHGGLANRRFWAPQLASLSDRYRVVALDLGGHGESGVGRARWTMAAFAGDVRAVADALDLRRLVLVGNSLGGPVALEAAALLRGRAIGVVGVDTLHDVTVRMPVELARERARAFGADFAAACRAMTAQLFHTDADPALRAWAEHEMLATPREVAVGMMEGFGDYDLAAAARGAGVPVRAIMGDLWPVNVERNRSVVPDFDAVVVPHAGHYVMLERPEEFDRILARMVEAMEARAAREPGRG